MKRLIVVLSLCAVAGSQAGAQSRIPETGLAAEGDGRWTDALRIYHAELRQEPETAELWLRVADIEARLGRAPESIAALQRASAASGDPGVFARLSQAYAAGGHATSALRAIEAALALEPASDAHLRAHATLATWAGEYQAAAASYGTLRKAHPDEASLTRALARVHLWSGSSNAAVSTYRAYLAGSDADPGVWLELARAESWRGNFAGAFDALQQYRVRFGETPAFARERVATLARGGRPREALRHLEPLLAASPGDYELTLSKTIALASVRRRGAAASSLTGVNALQPGRADTRAAESLLRTLLGSSVGPTTTFYSDSDGLQTVKLAPRFDLGFRSDTRLHGGYEHIELQARAGSGLDQVSGAGRAAVEHVWAGLSQRVGPVTIGGSVGQARPERQELTTYGAFVRFAPADAFAASIERSSGFTAISPRTVGLGITRLGHRALVDWSPGVRSHVALEGSYEDLSDGNARWEVFAAPRVAVARTQHLNLDLGLLVHQFGATHDFDHGYYDPRRYESYSVVVSPYWKASENIGVGLSAGLGGQRDSRAPAFRPGGNASVEATFGIYERWLLKIHGSTTTNRRLDSGAFQGYSGGVVLFRRF